jgi:hypothetical protein
MIDTPTWCFQSSLFSPHGDVPRRIARIELLEGRLEQREAVLRLEIEEIVELRRSVCDVFVSSKNGRSTIRIRPSRRLKNMLVLSMFRYTRGSIAGREGRSLIDDWKTRKNDGARLRANRINLHCWPKQWRE